MYPLVELHDGLIRCKIGIFKMYFNSLLVLLQFFNLFYSVLYLNSTSMSLKLSFFLDFYLLSLYYFFYSSFAQHILPFPLRFYYNFTPRLFTQFTLIKEALVTHAHTPCPTLCMFCLQGIEKIKM